MSKALLKKQNTRATDPNALQNRASNPAKSVWVGASAGSGKTKVLTDRILRLLLPDQQNLNACAPHKILALTFTKAAASEMALRINNYLSNWAVMSLEGEEGLIENLKQLLGYNPTQDQIEAARKLFAEVVDTPGGLKIMTIHSFCQSILGRFPLEAVLTPGFKALEEAQATQFLKQAQRAVFKQAEEEKASPLANAIHNLVLSQNEEQFFNLLKNVISERKQLQKILKENFGTVGLYTALCTHLKVPAGKTNEDVLYEACSSDNFNESGLWAACKSLAEGTEKTDQPRGIQIQNWLEKNQRLRADNFEIYKQLYLTKAGTIQKSLATATIKKQYADEVNILQIEAQRVFDLIKTMEAIKIATLTRDLFMVAEAILEEYQRLKAQMSALDFDDLILRTLDLLQGETITMQGLDITPWVRYKLDQGIDHMLVDEAQDTNPEQWKIIDILTDDFFEGMEESDPPRTLFVVGDQKQSIFSFQRAAPEKFIEMREWFKQKITSANKPFEDVNFNVSFRSVKSVLTLVDTIFLPPEIKSGLGDEEINHEAYRYTQAGVVELWPLFENPEKIEYDPWEPPTKIIESSSGAAQMAAHIGDTIQKWITEQETLASYNRPIEAGDIMILVRSRNKFIDQLVRALKIRNVPVSGVDRMVLSEQLVVQDLCAAANFALLPEDDLNLAGVLKSPFIGWNEEQIFDVCYNRKGQSLWSVVKEKSSKPVIQWLENLIYDGGKVRPYEFFSSILQNKCPASKSGLSAIKSRLGDESLDPLDEFLNNTLNFESDNIPTLQNFIQAQLHNESQIKRQMEEAGSAVRIMTVHGAKGLQAPIVILPDTIRSNGSTKPDRILWPDKSEAELPYFCPQSGNLPEPCETAMSVLKERNDQEYRRLLYVALTRAEERLYIGGYKGSKKQSDDCWYNYAAKGFENLEHVETLEDGTLRYTNPATDKPDRAGKEKTTTDIKATAAPDWLFTPIKDEPFPPRPLMPSRPSESDVPALSPLKANDDYRFLRGNITHKLLQILPDMSSTDRKQAAERYVAQPAHELSEKIQRSIVSETLKILEDPKFSAIFGKNSMAEVPITGLVGNKLISGQIDRLLVTDDEVFIIDYKTNRPPPKDVQNVPQLYINQMKAYADIMKDIYKGKKIRTALVWTDGAELMELNVL